MPVHANTMTPAGCPAPPLCLYISLKRPASRVTSSVTSRKLEACLRRSKMNQPSSASKALAAVLLLAACVAATAQYGGSSSAPGTGPADGAGYLLGVAAAALAVAAFVWT